MKLCGKGKITILLMLLLIYISALEAASISLTADIFKLSVVEASEYQTIDALQIGDKVVDKSWDWEFRTGDDYTYREGDVRKSLVWLVVADNHYGEDSGVTLLSEELINVPSFSYINSDRYWEDSALRYWLNSIDIYAGEGFYRAFSGSFKNSIITVDLPNKETISPNKEYHTRDNVFILSTTELGDTLHNFTPIIGQAYPYFEGMEQSNRSAKLDGATSWYWTRSPRTGGEEADFSLNIVCVDYKGGFAYKQGDLTDSPEEPWPPTLADRPAVNLKSGTLITAKPDKDGIYEIVGLIHDESPDQALGDINNDGNIDVQDVVLAMRYVLVLENFSEVQKKAADVNLDGEIDIRDITLIMRRALDIIDNF